MIFENIDCMELMKKYPDKHFDIAIVDPPYGIFSKKSSRMAWKKESDGGTWSSKYKGQCKEWDIKPNDNYFNELFRVSKEQIIFGANHYEYSFDNYIVWKKLTISESFSMGMCEIASVSIKGNPKIFEYAPQDTNRFHPCQKPIALYKWLAKNYCKQTDLILDTHVGSASSLIAFEDMGLDYVGCELDKEYYEKACERIKKYRSQTKLFESNFDQ